MSRIYYKQDLPRSKLITKTVLAFGFLAILLLSIFMNPEKMNLLSCQFLESTGFSCPTCGLSRSFYAMSHLSVAESISLHLMGPLLYLGLIALFLKYSIEVVAKKEVQFKLHPINSRKVIILFSFLWISYILIRFITEI